ncbi:MAG: ATP-binding protein, partial [Thermoplasmata archaeon]
IPVNYSYTVQDGGTFYGIDEITKAPVFLNRKKFPSSHELVLGMTGFGKSFFIKITMMREKISRGINVKIIDPLGEYENVGLSIGSKKIDLLNMEMNMFEKIEYLSIKENVDRALALFITLFDLNTEDKGIIDTALTLMFENDHSIKFLQEFIKNNRPETYSKISPLFEGSLRKFVTGKNPDLRGDVIINLGNIPKRLLSFYMLLSLDLIMRINEEKETNLIIDEAHYLMSEETVTSLERYLRHARHNNISMILISQSANDFSKSKSTISIMENCSIHILFRHQNVNDEIINFYNLDEKLIDFVKYGAGFNGKYSLAIMKVPGYESILRIESNKWEMGLLNEVRKS